MKKIALLFLTTCVICAVSFAQEHEDQTKVKKTSNLGQKVHNTFSRHKHYKGYKVKKTKDIDGRDIKEKKKVDNS